MKSTWMIEPTYRDGKRMYRAYRLLDKREPDTAGNREYKGRYSERRECVEDLVDLLNSGDLIS